MVTFKQELAGREAVQMLGKEHWKRTRESSRAQGGGTGRRPVWLEQQGSERGLGARECSPEGHFRDFGFHNKTESHD